MNPRDDPNWLGVGCCGSRYRRERCSCDSLARATHEFDGRERAGSLLKIGVSVGDRGVNWGEFDTESNQWDTFQNRCARWSRSIVAS